MNRNHYFKFIEELIELKSDEEKLREKYFKYQNDSYAIFRKEKEEFLKIGINYEIDFNKNQSNIKKAIENILGHNLKNIRINSLQDYYNEKHNIIDMKEHKNEILANSIKELKKDNSTVIRENKSYGYRGDF